MNDRIQKLQHFLDAEIVRRSELLNQINSLDTEITALSRQELNLRQASALCDVIIEKMNQSSVEEIESLISEGLQFIFRKDYRFKMNPTIKRGAITYRFSLEVDGKEEENLMDAQGGGIISVISVLLRIVTILISKGMRRFLVLDESLGMLSEEYIGNASKFIKQLGHQLGFTIVLVTHQQLFKQHADVVYNVENGIVDCVSNHE